ncbi:TetR/AcrR family transcriptional regulator [Sinorhizobium garamanticum]|uniref:TetR/AcrR family transcriptional regulator n=1 Tax=Sinorhizobium garamanticum TaxID=680247 RepID=A0ABY8DAU9_9HYPH|nr:TetR/AcrR family transcriptional regulator [Sinorhizobium garamanticum]WEX86665.1 TetR/AcrR family transcriptional regulator [Sinorhizobium garamanticum]
MTNAKRGRPVQYDREQALERASDLFWSAGFAATSLDDLSAATQMTRPSLAGAFGDKEALYIAALERYRDASVDAMREILSGKRPLRKELADVLRKATDVYMASADAARGCMLIGTASVEAVHRPAVRRVLQESLGAFNVVLEERMCKAIADGELDTEADAAGLASVTSAVMHSLAVRARAGEPRNALDKLSGAAVDLICGRRERPE